MRWTLNRLGLAMGLTALALAVPCAAWFWVGSRAVERQAQDLANAADRYARDSDCANHSLPIDLTGPRAQASHHGLLWIQRRLLSAHTSTVPDRDEATSNG